MSVCTKNQKGGNKNQGSPAFGYQPIVCPSRGQTLLVCMGLLCLFLCPACRHQEEGEGVVARVNGEPIPFSDFWEEYKSRYSEAADPSSPQPDVMRAMKKGVLSDLIREKLLLQEAGRRGITVPEEILEARIKEVQEGYTGSDFRKSLMVHSRGYGPWRQALKNNLTVEALYRQATVETEPVTREEVEVYYEKNYDSYLIPETVHLKQIVVKNRSLAQSLRKRLQKGEDFAALASEYSIAPEKEQAGNLGAFRKGELPEALEKAAFSTKVGKTSPLVQTLYGYHLLKVDKKTPAHLAPVEEVRKTIEKELLGEKKEARYMQWVDALMKKADIQVHETLKEMLLDSNTSPSIPSSQEVEDEPRKEP